MVFRDKLADQFRPHQMCLESAKHTGFQHIPPNTQSIAAGACVVGRRASVMSFTSFRDSSTANATTQQPGQQIDGPPCPLATDPSLAIQDGSPSSLLAHLHSLPKVIRDDAQLGDIMYDETVGQIVSGHPLAGRRVLYEFLSVPDPTANIEFIVENSGAASPVAGPFQGGAAARS